MWATLSMVLERASRCSSPWAIQKIAVSVVWIVCSEGRLTLNSSLQFENKQSRLSRYSIPPGATGEANVTGTGDKNREISSQFVDCRSAQAEKLTAYKLEESS